METQVKRTNSDGGRFRDEREELEANVIATALDMRLKDADSPYQFDGVTLGDTLTEGYEAEWREAADKFLAAVDALLELEARDDWKNFS